MFRAFFIFIMFFFVPLFVIDAAAQSEKGMEEALLYLEKRTTDLGNYINRSNRIQERLLNRLRKKEARMLAKLAVKDSVAYKQYLQRSPGFDSIAVLSKDTTALARMTKRHNATIDSLKGIGQFLRKQGSKLTALEGMSGQALPGGDYSDKIAELQAKLNAEQHIRDLVRARTQSLEQMATNISIPGLKGIQKDIYYAQERIKAWRNLADDPDAAEEKALEYLQGIEGFELSSNKGVFGLNGVSSASDLQAMGYQTKEGMSGLLKERFGSLQIVQESMQGQVNKYSDKLNQVTDKVKEAGNLSRDARQGLQEAKAAKDKLKHIEKPAFHKNPERGKPFWLRLETQYNFQTTRATPDSLRPAMVELGAGVAFKHTTSLSYGIGIAASTGLGQDWQHLRLSYEGISARIYADWKLWFGFSLQAGYERAFRPQNRSYLQENNRNQQQPSITSDNALEAAFGGGQDAAYFGIMKRYRISNKWSGNFMAGYNFLWQRSNLRTPFMLRVGWAK